MNCLRFLKKLSFLSPVNRLQWFPPFFFMGVKVLQLDEDWQTVRIRLPLNMFSKNMGDSMFGGYQASLADPIAALACVKRFPGYSAWTRAMVIDFQRPGSTHLELRFYFDEVLYQQIKLDLQNKGRSTPTFEFAYYLEDGTLCTKISNTVAIRPDNYLASRESN